MDFIDDGARPRILFQARPSLSSSPPETLKISKLHAASCLFSAGAFFVAALLLLSHTSFLFILMIWISLSLLLAPFSPPSITGGDPRVGLGDPLPSHSSKPIEPDEPRSRPSFRWNPKPVAPLFSPTATLISKPDEKRGSAPDALDGESAKKEVNQQEEKWTADDLDLLKRQISKHPSGMPGRWERVVEAFNGRHELDSVIRTAKSLAEKSPSLGDPFAQFLKQRKPLDKRADTANVDLLASQNGRWSSGDDIALLNALKAFPKDAPMRWEKVAAAVPGKSKNQCMRRVSELKKDFQSKKNLES